MLYYDQGMFEEVNYRPSAIPAEVMAGGVSINMVTKDASNKWRGNMRYYFSNDDLQAENHLARHSAEGCADQFLGNPTQKTYDMNLSGGGAIVQNRLWVNGTVRRWVVNKLTNAAQLRRFAGARRQHAEELLGQSRRVAHEQQKLMVSYLWNDKIRGHRRDTTPTSSRHRRVLQTNPAQTTQVKYTAVRQPAGVRIERSASWTARPTTPISPARRPTRSAMSGLRPVGSANFASNRARSNNRTRATSSTTRCPTTSADSAASTCSKPACSGAACTTSRNTRCRAITTTWIYTNGTAEIACGCSTPRSTPKNIDHSARASSSRTTGRSAAGSR